MSYREYLQEVLCNPERPWASVNIIHWSDSTVAFIERQYMFGYTPDECRKQIHLFKRR